MFFVKCRGIIFELMWVVNGNDMSCRCFLCWKTIISHGLLVFIKLNNYFCKKNRNMTFVNSNDIRHTNVWNEVKNWKKEDKVTLITLLSISLADSSVKEESPEEKTKRMISKYADCWKGQESAEDIISLINAGKHSSMDALKF